MKYLHTGAYVPPPPDIEADPFEDLGPDGGSGVVVWLAAALLAFAFAAGFIFRGYL
jgi:hypothetical protein